MTKGIVASLALAGVVGLSACRRESDKPDMQTIVTEQPAPTAPAHTNRLAQEKSPYLLQHQHNPVDWYAWGEEAFARARQENRPIFLSIGYSTCHWCHVMERESFESPEVAGFLNAHFVSIKVDREERPDVDKIYMTFVQATSGQGGWPLNVFLTPDLKPFFGGTYFPPDSRYGRPGFLQTLKQVAQLWQTRRAELANSAADIHARLELNAEHLDFAIALAETMLARFYDTENGGFWQSIADAKDLILRVKEDYDGAEPSGNSVAILALLKLGKITDRNAFTQAAEKSLRLFAHRLQQVPQAVPCMLQALDFSLDEPWRAVVAGDPGSPDTRTLLRAVHSVYQPNKVVLGTTGPVESFAKTLPAREGPVVYLCSGTACQPPTTDPAKIKELLTAKGRAGGP
jgi:uncharacterized protein YyaL (SSP411 family)